MLDLELLRSFVSVVDAGGFTRAGERVRRTQSTVSQQIKRLEEDVGQPLLIRSGKDVTPTRGPDKVVTFKEMSRVLAGFLDGRADEGLEDPALGDLLGPAHREDEHRRDGDLELALLEAEDLPHEQRGCDDRGEFLRGGVGFG